MARKITLRISGKAERFLDRMLEMGYSESDIIARSLWLMQKATEGRIAEIREGKDKTEEVLHVFTVDESHGE